MNFETIDLSNLGDQSIDFSVTRSAGFENTVDFYPVDADGNVTDSDGNLIAPGETGYLNAAIANRLGADISNPGGGVTSEFTVEFSGGAFYAPLLAVDSDFSPFADSDDSNDPVVYFTFPEANNDGFNHIVGTEGQLGFEDLPDGGDEDFDDIVLNFDITGISEEELEPEEPVDETPVEEEPEPEEPVDETPVEEEPVEEEPVEEIPVEEEPVDETPVEEEPAPEIEEPVTEEPVEEDPVGTSSISGLKFNDSNNSTIRDSELVQGADPDVVFVIDVSPSTKFDSTRFEGSVDIGDLNNDGRDSDTIDAEIFAFTALNQQLNADPNLRNVDIAVVRFGSSAFKIFEGTPSEDLDGNNIPDVIDVLNNDLDQIGGTNFTNALNEAESIFTEDFMTQPGEGNLIFISDGDSGANSQTPEIATRLRDDLGINITAFGAGTNSNIDVISQVDPGATQFTTTDQLIDIFGDLNNNADGDGGGSQSTLEEVVPGVTIYIDLNENGTLDPDEPSQVTDENGEYIFEGLAAGTYTLREVTPDGFTSTTGDMTITLGDGEAIEGIDFGNISDEELAMLNVEPDM